MSVFSIFTTKKRRQHKKSEPSPTEYYAQIASRISVCKIVLLFVLVIFIAFGFTFYGKDLTIENFRYMLKFMSVDSASVSNAGNTISFEGDGSSIFALIRGDVAVVNSGGIAVYDTAGSRLLREKTRYNEPMAVTNDKSLIVADRTSTRLDIYSAYSLLYTQNFSYPLLSLAGSPSGKYGVVTSALGYKSGVEIYDKEYRPIFKYYFADRYTVRLALSDDGKTALAAALTNDADGSLHAYFYFFRPEESEQPVAVLDFVDELALGAAFFDNGSCALLTSEALRFTDASGNITATVRLTGRTLKSFFPFDEYCVLAFADTGLSGATTLEIYDRSGNRTIARNVNGEVSHVDIIGEYMYYYSEGEFCTVDLKSRVEDKRDSVAVDYAGLLYEPDSDNIIMFYKNTAKVYNRSDFPTETLAS